jgi:glycosyltransferase involved in cell wall biosynthesis
MTRCSEVEHPQSMDNSHRNPHLPPVKILSNVPTFDSDFCQPLTNQFLNEKIGCPTRILNLLRLTVRSYKYDAIFLNCASFETMFICSILSLLPFNRCKIICADLILRLPLTVYQTMLASIKRLVLKRVNLFILFHKDFSDYTNIYGIDTDRVQYMPFKVNSLDLIQRISPVEGEYIFSGGVSLRDWKTLELAMKGLDTPLIISIPNDEYLSRTKEETSLPHYDKFDCQLEIVRDDGSQESWLRLIAGSKFVILPILQKSINASGISMCLIAMALRKCVIITEGPSTRGILDESNSIVVPPGDPESLRKAIERANTDRGLRSRLAEAGYRYALSCGDTSRLHRDFLACILHVANHKTKRMRKSFGLGIY